jgi:hypothetical protein
MCRLNILAKPSLPCSGDKKLMCLFPYHGVCQFDVLILSGKESFHEFSQVLLKILKNNGLSVKNLLKGITVGF